MVYAALQFCPGVQTLIETLVWQDAGTKGWSSIESLNCGQWSNASRAFLPFFFERSKRPNLIRDSKFRWELWQSLLLGGRRSIGRPLLMAHVAAAENGFLGYGSQRELERSGRH
jgi:hypothetical protein